MGPNKRHAAAVPSVQQQNEKKQKTATSAPLSTPKPAKPTAMTAGSSTVVPATPGAAVDPAAKRKQQQSPAKEPRPEKRPKTTQTEKTTSKKQSPNQPAQKQPEPISLPLEPHAAILKELESKYDVRTLSVISSSKMEKRINSVLSHIEGKPADTGAQDGQTTASSASRPGIVLLHCRVADTNKMISIAEIVKQRIREGRFSKETAGADGAAKKKGKKGSKLSKTAWYQYNRIYDVSVPKEAGDAPVSGADEEDDGFAPAVHRLDEALKGKNDSNRQITTYMSIILSRTPVVELQKNLEISVQTSIDPLEVEFEQWVART
ncbi:hypothetical protein Sste5346_000866 [Sporothrix stenoceras]|uniref:DNA/RNA-binding protein Alba-like domain-containing protein n=1 Tax=Sporothrix stenoceras TaxID=5173 RepID=A0ABR3ZRY0_9PEZI